MKRYFLFSLMLLCITLAHAQFNGAGSGTSSDPYRIFNADQLNSVRNFLNIQNVCFSLEADIDLKQWIAENNPKQGWQPIGTENAPFCGNFNGNGHTISNLEINRPNSDYVGLFGYVDNGIIESLSIEFNITGNNYVGCLVGCLKPSQKSSSTISSITAKGILSGNDNVGGMVGGITFKNIDPKMTVTVTLTLCKVFADIEAHDNIGGIVGASVNTIPAYSSTQYNISNNISKSYYSGNISGNDGVGGICGYIYVDNTYYYRPITEINSCNSNININSLLYAGGLVGKCSALYNSRYFQNHIRNSYSTGHILKAECAGGCIGQMIGYNGKDSESLISNTYSNFDIITGDGIGGIIDVLKNGKCESNVAINKALYSTDVIARITPTTSGVGATGTSSENKAWTFTEMYKNLVKQDIPDDGLENGTNTGLSALKSEATYKGLGWDFDDSWAIEEGKSFPYLKFQTAPLLFDQALVSDMTHIEGQCIEDGEVHVKVGTKTYTTTSNYNKWAIDIDPLCAGDIVELYCVANNKFPSYSIYTVVNHKGEGTQEDPYQICSAGDMQAMHDKGYYKLMNDIDLTEWIEANNPDEGWIPADGDFITEFDGNGHTISGLWTSGPSNHTGLFRSLNTSGTIKSLNLIVSSKGIYGGIYTGGLVGVNNGLISACMVSGSPIRSDKYECYVGGIAGISYGSIIDCYSENTIYATASSSSYGAGIVGRNKGKVLNCLAKGDLTGSRVAGIAGQNSTSNAEINSCVALNKEIYGSVAALRIVAGLDNAAIPAMNNYALKGIIVDSKGEVVQINDDPTNGVGITQEQGMSLSTYNDMGWDFEKLWGIDDGYTYPYFKRNKVFVSEIQLNKNEISAIMGEAVQLSVIVSPENATNKNVVWKSSDESVATVDNNGMVHIIKPGETIITVSTTDGSNLTKECIISIGAGVSAPHLDTNEIVDVFTLHGVKLLEQVKMSETVRLAKGVYLIKSKGKSFKLKI